MLAPLKFASRTEFSFWSLVFGARLTHPSAERRVLEVTRGRTAALSVLSLGVFPAPAALPSPLMVGKVGGEGIALMSMMRGRRTLTGAGGEAAAGTRTASGADDALLDAREWVDVPGEMS
jgi:hypothetical protein